VALIRAVIENREEAPTARKRKLSVRAFRTEPTEVRRLHPDRTMRRFGPTGAAVSLAVLVAACGAPDPESNTGLLGATIETAADVAPSDAPISFTPCSLQTGGDDGRAECANVEMPLDWDAVGSGTINFFVKRLPGRGAGPRRQLWLLQGGPGGAGDGLEPIAAEIAAQDPDLDVYIPDHRGTGRSGRLDCPVERGKLGFKYANCVTEMKMRWGGSGLATFNTTSAARDVGSVIRRTRAPNQEVHLYGVSYGTYWAQRYLQLFPNQPTGVTLDSVCQSGLCSYLKMGYWFDRVGQKYMDECAADPVCSEMLGKTPIVKLREAIARASSRSCAGLTRIDGNTLRRIYGWLISSFELRALIPSTAFRILRCNADDQLALRNFENALGDVLDDGNGAPQKDELDSDILGMHIAFSELEEEPPISNGELSGLLADAVFAVHDPKIRDAYDVWPRYAHDRWVGKYSTSSVPILMMNGTLDPQTPQEFAETVAPHYVQPGQGLVILPRAAHGVIHQSPIDASPTEPACGMTLWHQFLRAPERPLDTSCRASILQHDFAGSPALADHFFGRRTLWGPGWSRTDGSAGGQPIAGVAATPAQEAALRVELRRAVRATRPLERALGLRAGAGVER